MIKKKIKLYRFKELKKEMQKKVIEEYREVYATIIYEDLEYYLNEKLKEILKEKNIYFEELKIRYDLSYRQGSGASFTGDFVWKNKNINIALGYLSNLYCHSNTTNIEFEDFENTTDKEEREFKELYNDICNEIEKVGHDYLDEVGKDENIKEMIEANDYYFREDGRMEK